MCRRLCSRLAGFVVVLLPKYLLALLVLFILDASLFASSNVTIGPGPCLSPVDASLAPFQFRSFFVGELS